MTPRRQMGFIQSRKLLEEYGIPLAGTMVRNPADVNDAARKEGYPVALKGITPDFVHKSDVGFVFLGVKNDEGMEKALRNLQHNMSQAGVLDIEGFLIQSMSQRGLELLIGSKQDPSFGPVTMVGNGGRFVELFADVAPGIGLLDREDIIRMLKSTMAGKILDGYRGPALDREAVIALTTGVSRLMCDHAEILEIDLNPVIVYNKGFSVVDSRLIIGEPVFNPRDIHLSQEKMKSLEAIFRPQSVAIVGASRPGTIGGNILKNCLRIPRVYAVNPKLTTLGLMPCYPGLKQLPEVPDVAVFATNAETTVRAFEEFCEIGGKGAVIFSDGFAESGMQELENRLSRTSRQSGVAYIGPNCMGVIDNFSGLNTLFIAEHRTASITEASGIGLISQSGGVGVEALEMLAADNQGIGKWVSCGNASSVGIPEILAHMGDDPRIRIIAVYIEGLSEGLKLMEVGKNVTQRKPVLVIKGGVWGGAPATLSHTASLAGDAEAFRACCIQAGFYLIQELTEDPKILINTLSILAAQPPSNGSRVAIVSVGGGAGILLADHVTHEGLSLASFTHETTAGLKRLMEPSLRARNPEDRMRILEQIGHNPFDLLGDCDDDRLLETLRLLDQDPNTDIIMAAIYVQVPFLSEYLPERLVDLKKQLTKPLIVSLRGFSEYVARCRQYLFARKFHTYTVPMIKPLTLAVKIWEDYRHLNWPASSC